MSNNCRLVSTFRTSRKKNCLLGASTSMYRQIPHLCNLLKHHPFPLFKRTLLDLLPSVLDFVRKSSMLIWKQMMLLDIRPELITEGHEVFVILSHTHRFVTPI